MKKLSDVAVYRAYIEAKSIPGRSASDVAADFGLTRGQLYEIVVRVKVGNPARIRIETERARLRVLWEHRYKTRAASMPAGRRAEVVVEWRKLIKSMAADGFPKLTIAQLLKKDRATIIHHLTA